MNQRLPRLPFWVWPLVAVLVGGFLMALHLWMSAPKMPVYQGKSISQWIVQLDRAAELHPARFNEVAEAQAAIRAIGTNALPFAMANLHARATLANRAEHWLAKRAPWLKLHPTNVADQWALGVQILDILGPIATPSLPELIAEATNHPGYSEEAMLSVGDAAVPAFTNLLRTTAFPETGVLIRAWAAMPRAQLKSREAVLAVLKELSQSKDRDAANAASNVLSPAVFYVEAPRE